MTVAIDRATGKRRGDRAPRPGPGQRLKRSYQKHWYAYAMIAPVVLVLGVIVLYPWSTASTSRSPTRTA